MGTRKTKNNKIVGISITLLGALWVVYDFYTKATQLKKDASDLAKMMADPPIYLPYIIVAVGIIIIARLLWDKDENSRPLSNEDEFIKKSELTDAFGKPLLASQDLEGWSELEEITLSQAACLFAGISPPEDGSVPDAAKPKLEKLKQLMRDKKLTSFAIDLSITDKYSKKLSQIASGTKENIRSDARVLVSELVGAIEPAEGTPRFLIGDKDEE